MSSTQQSTSSYLNNFYCLNSNTSVGKNMRPYHKAPEDWNSPCSNSPCSSSTPRGLRDEPRPGTRAAFDMIPTSSSCLPRSSINEYENNEPNMNEFYEQNSYRNYHDLDVPGFVYAFRSGAAQRSATLKIKGKEAIMRDCINREDLTSSDRTSSFGNGVRSSREVVPLGGNNSSGGSGGIITSSAGMINSTSNTTREILFSNSWNLQPRTSSSWTTDNQLPPIRLITREVPITGRMGPCRETNNPRLFPRDCVVHREPLHPLFEIAGPNLYFEEDDAEDLGGPQHVLVHGCRKTEKPKKKNSEMNRNINVLTSSINSTDYIPSEVGARTARLGPKGARNIKRMGPNNIKLERTSTGSRSSCRVSRSHSPGSFGRSTRMRHVSRSLLDTPRKSVDKLLNFVVERLDNTLLGCGVLSQNSEIRKSLQKNKTKTNTLTRVMIEDSSQTHNEDDSSHANKTLTHDLLNKNYDDNRNEDKPEGRRSTLGSSSLQLKDSTHQKEPPRYWVLFPQLYAHPKVELASETRDWVTLDIFSPDAERNGPLSWKIFLFQVKVAFVAAFIFCLCELLPGVKISHDEILNDSLSLLILKSMGFPFVFGLSSIPIVLWCVFFDIDALTYDLYKFFLKRVYCFSFFLLSLTIFICNTNYLPRFLRETVGGVFADIADFNTNPNSETIQSQKRFDTCSTPKPQHVFAVLLFEAAVFSLPYIEFVRRALNYQDWKDPSRFFMISSSGSGAKKNLITRPEVDLHQVERSNNITLLGTSDVFKSTTALCSRASGGEHHQETSSPSPRVEDNGSAKNTSNDDLRRLTPSRLRSSSYEMNDSQELCVVLKNIIFDNTASSTRPAAPPSTSLLTSRQQTMPKLDIIPLASMPTIEEIDSVMAEAIVNDEEVVNDSNSEGNQGIASDEISTGASGIDEDITGSYELKEIRQVENERNSSSSDKDKNHADPNNLDHRLEDFEDVDGTMINISKSRKTTISCLSGHMLKKGKRNNFTNLPTSSENKGTSGQRQGGPPHGGSRLVVLQGIFCLMIQVLSALVAIVFVVCDIFYLAPMAAEEETPEAAFWIKLARPVGLIVLKKLVYMGANFPYQAGGWYPFPPTRVFFPFALAFFEGLISAFFFLSTRSVTGLLTNLSFDWFSWSFRLWRMGDKGDSYRCLRRLKIRRGHLKPVPARDASGNVSDGIPAHRLKATDCLNYTMCESTAFISLLILFPVIKILQESSDGNVFPNRARALDQLYPLGAQSLLFLCIAFCQDLLQDRYFMIKFVLS